MRSDGSIAKKGKSAGPNQIDTSNNSGMDLIQNPLLCLEAMIQADPQAETKYHDQIVRHFDEKARIYLMKLNG